MAGVNNRQQSLRIALYWSSLWMDPRLFISHLPWQKSLWFGTFVIANAHKPSSPICVCKWTLYCSRMTRMWLKQTLTRCLHVLTRFPIARSQKAHSTSCLISVWFWSFAFKKKKKSNILYLFLQKSWDTPQQKWLWRISSM